MYYSLFIGVFLNYLKESGYKNNYYLKELELRNFRYNLKKLLFIYDKILTELRCELIDQLFLVRHTNLFYNFIF